MKKLLATTALVATMFAGAQSAMANPVITLNLSTAGATAAECSAGSVGETSSFSGDTCTITSTNGVAGFGSTFLNFQLGNFSFNNEAGFGFPDMAEPAFWLRSGATSSAAGVLTVTASVTGYTIPLGTIPLQSTASGTVDAGTVVNISDYFSGANDGTPGAGTQLYSTTWTGFASGAAPGGVVTSNVDNTGLYAESWIETITADGANETTGVQGTLQTGVPSPTPLSLLGFGLVALAFVTRRRGFQN